MTLQKIHSVYFIGIGGIGMSALARYFKHQGKRVIGYDKTPTELTLALESEGIAIHFEDWSEQALTGLDKEHTLVVYTPAIPREMGELLAFQAAGYKLMKRSEILGFITQHEKGIGVAGTHGKTTTSTLLAHVLHENGGCHAFLGGISSNYNSNLILDPKSEWTVMEADEFDRSFLQLHPYIGVLTSIDADHLDIYGDKNHVEEGFHAYINQIHPEGFVLVHAGIQLSSKCRQISYSAKEKAAIYAENIRYEQGAFLFDFHYDKLYWKNVVLGIPGIHNVENALAVMGICIEIGLGEAEIRNSLQRFKGVKRRFEYHIQSEKLIYIDDYAHHPSEIHALIESVRLLYPHKTICGIFQPHLFSRTRDFMEGFAEELSKLDEVILLPIYPARELPIEGITSNTLLERISLPNKQVLTPAETLTYLQSKNDWQVVLTIGAGDIDQLVQPINTLLK